MLKSKNDLTKMLRYLYKINKVLYNLYITHSNMEKKVVFLYFVSWNMRENSERRSAPEL